MDAEAAIEELVERLPPARTLAHLLGLAVLVAVVAPFVVYAVPQLVGADHSFVVVSGSMEPTISTGDVVVVESVPAEGIEEGDVVTFRQGTADRPTTHRVVDTRRTDEGLAFKTKGDANENPDRGWVGEEDVLGRVAFTVPLIGHVVRFVNTPLGLFTFLGLPVVLFVLLEVASVLRAGPDRGAAWTGGDGDGSEGRAAGERTAAPTAGEDGADEAVALTATDLRASLVVLLALVVYSGWTVLRSVSATGAPDPVSAAVCAGSVTALSFGVALHRTLPDGPTASATTDGDPGEERDATHASTGDDGGPDGPSADAGGGSSRDGPPPEELPALEDPATFGPIAADESDATGGEATEQDGDPGSDDGERTPATEGAQ